MTEFVSANTTASTSVERCQLIGDPDLYGLGVRLSFYISWAAGLLASALGTIEALKSPRFNSNVLLFTLLIVLIHSVHRGSFAALEWYIVINLAFMSLSTHIHLIPFFVFPAIKALLARVLMPTLEGYMEENNPTGTEDPTPLPQLSSLNQNAAIDSNPEEIIEDGVEKEAKRRVGKLYRIIYYNDPVGFGFTFLIYGIFGCCMPWVHFARSRSGYMDNCSVPVVYFGTFDIYNRHWQTFLKVTTVIWVPFSCLAILLGSYMVTRGIMKQRMYARTLEMMREQKNNQIGALWSDLDNIKDSLDNGQQVPGVVSEGANTSEPIQPISDTNQQTTGSRKNNATEEDEKQEVIKRVSEVQNRYCSRNRIARLTSFVVIAFSGIISIWNVEMTIQKNQINMDDNLSSIEQCVIIAQLEIPEPEVQKAVLATLRCPPILPQANTEAKIARLKGPDREVQMAALMTLKNQSELPQETVDFVVELLSQNFREGQTTALNLLQNQKVLTKATVDKITRYLHDPDECLRGEAVKALGAHSPLPKSVLDTISDLLKDKNASVRSAAEGVLKQPVLPKVLIHAIIQRIEDTAESSYQAITSILESKTDPAQTTVHILNQRLKDASTDFSEASLITLTSQKTLPKSVINSIAREHRAAEPAVRNAAPDLLKMQYGLLPAAADAITELLKNPDNNKQKAALEAFNHQYRSAQPSETIRTVTERLESPDKGIHVSTLEILANQFVLSQEAVTAIIKQLKQTEGYDQEKLYTAFKQQPASVKVAIGMLADLTYTDKGTATGLGATARPTDRTLKCLYETMIHRGFKESLSLHIRDNTVWADDGSGQKSFNLGANVDRFRSSIITSRPDGYPLSTTD
ncbi:Uncharacterized protein Y057_4038 [Fusarium fujikuroi]|nr:Uncharacterized protein Y057_4038 [Fusarium fujikuroi]